MSKGKYTNRIKKTRHKSNILISLSKEHGKFKDDVKSCFTNLDVTVKADYFRMSADSLPMLVVISLGSFVLSGLTWDLLKLGIKNVHKRFKGAQVEIRDTNSIIYAVFPNDKVNIIVIPDRYSEFKHIKTLDDLVSHLKKQQNNWHTKKLSEVCDISIGKTPARGNKKYWDEEKETSNIWLSIRDLNNTDKKKVFDSREYISNAGGNLFKKVKKGTLLASFKLTLGRLAFAGTDLYTNEAIASLKIRNSKELNKEYLYYYLTFFDWHAETKGDVKVKGKTLNKAKLKEIKVFFPPLPNQKRLVNILDKTFEKIDKVKENIGRNLKNSKELFESYLNNIFNNPDKDWIKEKLKDIGQTQTGLTPKTSNKGFYGNFIPFIKPADVNINDEGIIRYDNEGLSEKGLLAGRKIEKNSILMVCIGATIGKVGFSTKSVSCNQQINTLTPKNKHKPKMFYYILSTKSFFNKIIKASSQATLPIINKSKWENLSVVYPKLFTKQKLIVSKLESLSLKTKKMEANYKQKLLDLEELKKSILKRAFNGKL